MITTVQKILRVTFAPLKFHTFRRHMCASPSPSAALCCLINYVNITLPEPESKPFSNPRLPIRQLQISKNPLTRFSPDSSRIYGN